MASLPVYDIKKNKVGTIELSDDVFSAEVVPHLLNTAVRAQVAWKHEHKTANSRTRTEVSGTRKKMFKQKGTGQARHGDAKSPTFVGGGKAHGPKPRMVRHKINRKVMRKALITAISMNNKEDRLFIVDRLELEKPNSKAFAQWIKTFGLDKALVINSGDEPAEQNFNTSGRNVAFIKCLRPEGINVFDILKFKNLVLSQKAAKKLAERLTHV